jgi:DNA (cytosine-5)-methyltransferase 1
MLRTPAAIEGEGGARREDTQRANGRMVYVRDQMAQLAADNGLPVVDSLLPTPDTMAHLPARTPEQKAANKGKGGYSNLRETVVNDLPVMPTPMATDGTKGGLATAEERVEAGRQVDLPNQVRSFLPTPQVDDSKNTGHNVTRRPTLASAVYGETDWGKFAPAIRRWEIVTGTIAPAPTLPDGKNDTHRLSSAFTEWMMGLPAGWVTSVGLRRNEELKACGNGVVPQQAAMALRHLLGRFADA